jgi:hypothetical protein
MARNQETKWIQFSDSARELLVYFDSLGFCSHVQISYASFQVASGLASGHSLKAYHSKTLPSALYSTEFFAMSWTTSALMFVVFVLVQIEWRFELWTLKGELITMYRKPPSKSWLLLNAYADRNPTKIDGTGRGEEYEMQ